MVAPAATTQTYPSFSQESLQTQSGTITAWLPMSSPWVSIAACSNQIYQQRAGLGGNFMAFDPLYGESIVESQIPCLPTEVTSSWYQSNPTVTTVFGPTFVCPAAYYTVQQLIINPETQQVLCCPSQYSLFVPMTTGHETFPSQCTSKLTPGQILTYESTTPGGPWGVATTDVAFTTASTTGPTIVFAMHVNGFNVSPTSTSAAAASSSTSSSSSSTPSTSVSTTTSGAAIPPVSQATSPSSSASATSNPNGGGLSNGAIIGIAVGLSLLAIGAMVGALLFWRRRRARKAGSEMGPPVPYEKDGRDDRMPPELESKHGISEADPASKNTLYEIDGYAATHKAGRKQSIYEMPTPP